ncbi:MAG: hypothetical protein HY820_17140 [Acidobacteria bacterium]|nr:hypothetical protein [Acidobacteriota bacterium]
MKPQVLITPAFAHHLTTVMRATAMTYNRLERCCSNFASSLTRTIPLVGFVLLTLCSTKVQAQGFTLITPAAGSQVPAGQPVTVTWTGGNPSANVAVILIDVAANAFAQGFGVVPNSGSQVVTVPVSTGPYGSCGRTFRFYVEDSPRTTWTYGPVFTFVCPTTVGVADGDVSGLIAAINAANANPGPDTINLAPGGTYTLTQINGPDSYNGPSGLPIITGKLVINGNGAVIQRSSDPITPDFRIMFCLSCDMVLDGVTVRGGKGADGGGLVMKAVSNNPIDFSKVLIKNSTFTENEASGSGGAIMNYDRLTVVNSTISRNRSSSAYGGGGIMNWAAATTTIVHTTLFENRNYFGRGDAFAHAFSPNGSVILKNSILASPAEGVSDDCYPVSSTVMVSLGHNLASDSTCTLAGTGDLNTTNPKLNALANNGGPTWTHLPQPGSPVADAVPLADCTDADNAAVTSDQRGFARPQGPRCDIGSVDVASDSTPPVITPTVSGTLGTGGWYRSSVTVNWSVTDPQSGIVSSSCGTTSLTTDTPGVTVTCSATNGAGLLASANVTVKIDKTPPVITSSRTPPANGAGWNNTNVSVAFACSDGMSGVNSLSPVSALVSTEGVNQSVAANCTDNAGNPAAALVAGISIDKTNPTTVNATVNPNPVPVNAGILLSAAISDSGGSNLAAAEYSVNGSAAATLGAAGGTSAVVSGAIPGLSATGVYSICVHARDAAGNAGADDCLFLPVYDPNGGFVTGGGWINSPAGAYTAEPSLTGKATFGFESRYQNGANVPSGDTQFQFHVANLRFKSTSYEWLVIAGAKAQYKGSGTINGAGTYNFMLTAIDGDMPGGGGTDRFRIKIWAPGGTVYDNQMNGNDNADPTTVLGGGSIVIHKD